MHVFCSLHYPLILTEENKLIVLSSWLDVWDTDSIVLYYLYIVITRVQKT